MRTYDTLHRQGVLCCSGWTCQMAQMICVHMAYCGTDHLALLPCTAGDEPTLRLLPDRSEITGLQRALHGRGGGDRGPSFIDRIYDAFRPKQVGLAQGASQDTAARSGTGTMRPAC